MVGSYRIEIEEQSARRVEAALDALTAVYADLGPLGEPLQRDWFFPMELEQYATEGHGAWPLRSPAYTKQVDDKYGSRPLERLSDRTFKSLTQNIEGDTIFEATANEIDFGTAVTDESGFNYPLAQQTGTERMAIRRLIDVQNHNLRALAEISRRELIILLRNKGVRVL